MQVFVIINNVGTKINADVNAKNWLIKMYAITHIFGIQVIANVNVINIVENENKHKWSSCALNIVLFSIVFTINMGIGTYFAYNTSVSAGHGSKISHKTSRHRKSIITQSKLMIFW